MAQFDVYKNKNQSTKILYPYLLEIQTDLLSDLQTTVVIPLIDKNNYGGKKLETLHPVFEIMGKQYLSITTLIAGIERTNLGENIASLSQSRNEIISALDFMITGI
jgi:toxin CcdB